MICFEADESTFSSISKDKIIGLKVTRSTYWDNNVNKIGWSLYFLTFRKDSAHWLDMFSTLDEKIAKKWIDQCKEFSNEKNRTEQQKIDIRAEQLAFEKNLDFKQFTNDMAK